MLELVIFRSYLNCALKTSKLVQYYKNFKYLTLYVIKQRPIWQTCC